MSEIKLKNCPFCGGEAEVNLFLGNYCITCNECMGAIFPAKGMTKEEAIESWNTRKPMEKVVEELEERRAKFDCKSCRHFFNGKEKCNGDCTDALIEDLLDIVRNGGKE